MDHLIASVQKIVYRSIYFPISEVLLLILLFRNVSLLFCNVEAYLFRKVLKLLCH